MQTTRFKNEKQEEGTRRREIDKRNIRDAEEEDPPDDTIHLQSTQMNQSMFTIQAEDSLPLQSHMTRKVPNISAQLPLHCRQAEG
ncbi:hypothetical protein G5714_020036 [Onychostoma macrolepis]|uniref:Uncharacterized protein n=1 Tax=Onychostoma macrolepis TaxID=369639 RepID=A0A7J6BY77_9TELE|nr:hypothetical protein G5714_020036 [Onychostoma macrolepis]